MADFTELVDMLCRTVKWSETPIPVTLMNHTPGMAHKIIVAVIEQLAREGILIQTVHVDPSLAIEIGLREGSSMAEEAPTILALHHGLGRQVIFKRTAAANLN
jgi:hypothetical protein